MNGLVFVFLDPFFFIFGFFRVAFHFQHTVLCVCMCVCVCLQLIWDKTLNEIGVR